MPRECEQGAPGLRWWAKGAEQASPLGNKLRAFVDAGQPLCPCARQLDILKRFVIIYVGAWDEAQEFVLEIGCRS